MKKVHHISLSTVRKANESLVKRDPVSGHYVSNINSGRVVVSAIYSGRQYDVNLTPSEIAIAYEKSVKNSKK